MKKRTINRKSIPIQLCYELKMKISIIILVFSLCQIHANSTYGQNEKITLNLEDVSLEKALNQIETITDYKFIYKDNEVNYKKRVTISVTQTPLFTVLENLLSETDISYKISGKQIVLRNKRHLQPKAPEEDTGSKQQKFQVSGTVVDDQGVPLPGTNIVEKGTTNGTQSDFDGNFVLNVTDENASLEFYYIGFATQNIAVNGRNKIDVVLQESASGLEEVVVVGYGTQKKVNLTGAITTIKTEELNEIPTNNLSNTLAGRAPGVNITNSSGLSGASSSIRIRGSFGEPLYVIDGIVRDKEAFDALNANEVDQLSFLKDAATASIYGSRAGNGVVLVTTKKGVEQKPVFNFQTSYSSSQPTQTLLSDLTTATDELIYQNRVAEFNGTTPPNGDVEFDYFKDKSYNVNDFIWRNPSSLDYSMSVAGGGKAVTYYTLASYRSEEGSFKGLDYDKFNLRSNVSAKLSKSITLDVNIAASQQNHDRFYWPFSPDDDYDVSDLYRVTFNWPKTYPFYTEANGTPSNQITDYPVQTPMGSWLAWSVIDQIVGDRYIKTRKRQLSSIISLDIDLDDFVPGLSTKFVGSYLAEDYMRKHFLTFQENYVFNQADPDGNRFIPAAPDPNKTNTFTFSQNQEFISYNINTSWEYQADWFINYKNTFGKHGVSAMVVFEQAENGLYGAYAKAEDPVTNYDQDFVYSTDAERRYGRGYEEIGARQSIIGRANYDFKERYIAEFSFRYDGNTLFPEEGRWGFFPSFSGAWRISEESFIPETNWLNELKLRVSYGTTGNDLDVNNNRISPFSFMNTYQNNGSYIFGNDLYRGIGPGSTPNPNLTWATSTTYNAGIDFETFGKKLVGSIDVFNKKEVDILGSRLVTLPDNYGQSLAPENYAERSWRGGELSVMWRDFSEDGKFKYSIYGNIGYAKDQWDKIDQDPIFEPGGLRESESQIGQPINRIFGLKSMGIVRTQEQLDGLLADGFTQFGRDPYLGGLYFEDIRGDGYSKGPDGKIDGNDFQLLSENATPRINYGFGFNFGLGNFTLDAHFQGVSNYDRIISNQEGAGMRQHGGTVRPYYPIWASDVWTPENPDAEYPRVVGRNWYESGTGATSFWIHDGAYVRLKNLNLGYSLPRDIVETIGISSAQVFLNGTNIFSISDITEFHDPEQKNYDSYPVMKSYSIGMNFKF
ncbi:TonB-dependent receptor [Zobellia galactanivorans]|uniref:TonB-dependent receptor n=1 Tax=Zobellia TaxID=112040 RepID=UPI001C079C49|nr:MULTISPECIES: TonB-dependent receptor [Zobellia]MBU3026230.1 TonB-dependent receptor [Zobellia galactanivorans]MDO6517399.1 TonB-dependent receptor [Zobellia uliginosa]MDO6807292.1 TonB-dependent receptor [Zobellia galactanivorans]